MIRLKRSSRLVRFAYMGENLPPQRTSLCALVWLLAFKGFVLFVGLPAAIVAFAHLLITHWTIALTAFSGIALGIGLGFAGEAIIRWRRWWKAELATSPERHSLIREGYYAVKQRICPLIEIEP